MLRYFVSVTLPSMAIAAVWSFAIIFWVTRRIRAYQAERRLIQAQRQALRQAQDALATAISDSLTPDNVREQALPAYEALGRLMQEREISS